MENIGRQQINYSCNTNNVYDLTGTTGVEMKAKQNNNRPMMAVNRTIHVVTNEENDTYIIPEDDDYSHVSNSGTEDTVEQDGAD